MVSTRAVPACKAPDQNPGSQHPVQTRNIRVVWRINSPHPKGAAFVANLKARNIFKNLPKHITVTIDSNMMVPEIRDRIRQECRLDEINGQLEQLKPCFVDDEGDEETIPALTSDWDGVREVFFGSSHGDEDVYFTCIIRLRKDLEGVWENYGPPSGAGRVASRTAI